MIVKTLHLNPPLKDWNRYFIRSNLYLAPAFLTIFFQPGLPGFLDALNEISGL